MSKSTTKNENYNSEVIKVLDRRWNVSVHYIKKSIKGLDDPTETSETIKMEYNSLCEAQARVFAETLKQLDVQLKNKS